MDDMEEFEWLVSLGWDPTIGSPDNPAAWPGPAGQLAHRATNKADPYYVAPPEILAAPPAPAGGGSLLKIGAGLVAAYVAWWAWGG